MLRSYLTLTLRSLWRNRTYTLLNISGIAIGMAAVTLIYWQVAQINSYDTQHPHADRLYRIGEQIPPDATDGGWAVLPLLPTLLAENPAVETGTRLFSWQRNWLAYGKQETQQRIFHADTSLLSVLNFPLKAGNPHTALATPNAMVISEQVAAKLFRNQDPLGKTVTLDNGRAYVVRGVLSPRPIDTFSAVEIIIPINDLTPAEAGLTNWFTGSCQTYLRLQPGTDPVAFERSMAAFANRHYTGESKGRTLHLLPIGALLSSETHGQLTIILYGLSLIGGFILLVVTINFLNLSTALSLARSGEVALRTTLGATAGQTIGQFVLEATLAAGVGAGLGTLLLKALIPAYIDFFDIANRFSPQLPLSTALFMMGVVLLLGTVAGWSPAQYLTRLPVVTALQGKTITARRTPFRSTLVVVQFALATVLIICTGVMMEQNRFAHNQQTGFDKDNLISVELDRSYRNPALAESTVDNLIQRLRQDPNVLAISTTKGVPGVDLWYESTTYHNTDLNRAANFNQQPVDEAYLATFGIPVVAGRGLTAADTAVTNAMINETGARALGFATPDDAIGKVIRPDAALPYMVVGVFKDHFERGTHRLIPPTFFWPVARPGYATTAG